jgi:hypothetical protein
LNQQQFRFIILSKMMRKNEVVVVIVVHEVLVATIAVFVGIAITVVVVEVVWVE